MPFRYRLSDIVKMDIVEEKGVKVIELEFRFARYQLILDDEENSKKLIEMIIGKIVWPKKEVEEKTAVKMPRFYSKGDP